MRNIRVEASACLWWAVLLLFLPLRWLLAAVLAGSFHEFCHYLAIRAVGGKVEAVAIRLMGASITTPPLEARQELVCSLAGPVGSLVLVPFARFLPMTALCALVQCTFNLLPIYPMDGGRALRCIMEICRPRVDASAICSKIGKYCSMLLAVLVFLLACRYSLGYWSVLPGLILLYRSFTGKRPCKTADLALQ